MKKQLFIWLLLLCSSRAWAQLPVRESFEGTSAEHGYTANFFTISSGQYFNLASTPVPTFGGPGLTGVDGGFLVACESVRGTVSNTAPANGSVPGVVTLNAINNTQNYTNLKVIVAAADPRSSTNIARETDHLRVQYSYGSATGPYTTLFEFTGTNVGGTSSWTRVARFGTNVTGTATILTSAFSDHESSIPAGPGALYVRVEADYQGGIKELAFDNIRVTGTASTVVKPTITSNVGTSTLTFAEGTASPLTVFSDLTVGNPAIASNPTLTGATVTLGSYAGVQDDVTYTIPTGSGITLSSNTNGVLTFANSSSVGNYELLLESIKYKNTEVNNATAGDRTFTFVVRDGATESIPLSRIITVTTAINGTSLLPRFENFDSDGEGTRYASNTKTVILGGTNQGFLRLMGVAGGSASPGSNYGSSSTFTNLQGTGYWYTNGTKNIVTGNIGIVKLAPVNTTGFVNLHFKVKAGAGTGVFASADFLRFSYSLDGGQTWTVFANYFGNDNAGQGQLRLNGNAANPALSRAAADLDFALPATVAGTAVEFRVETALDADEIVFDDIQITGTQPPTVSTAAATSVTTTSAVLGGSVTADGGGTLTERGVVYVVGTGTPTTANTKALVLTSGVTVASFSGSVSGLTAGTQYTVRAYAINEAGTGYGAPVTFTTLTPTTINSITRTTPAAASTNASSVVYTATFGAAVTGLAAANFDLVAPGLSGTSIGTITGSGTTYAVTVNTGTGNGSLTLRLINATNTLPGISTALPFAGETYTIDKTAPTVSSVGVPASGTYGTGQALRFTVNFSEAVTVTGTPQLGLTLDTGGSVPANYASGSGTSTLVFTYTVVAGNADANGITVGTLALNGGTIRDAATNNATLTLNSVGATTNVLVDGVAPVVSSINRQTPAAATTNATSLTFRVTFSEAVTGVTPNDFTLTRTGTATGSISTATAVSPSVYDVTVTSASGNGTLRLDLNGSGTGIADTPAGNALSGGYTAGQPYTLDQTAPTVTALTTTAGASGTTTNTTPFSFTVTFSEAVTGFASSGITVGNGTVTSGPTAGSGNSYTFTVTPTTAGTATTVLVAANAALDAAGNSSTASSTYSLTYTLPTATVTGISKLTPTAAQSAGGTATAQVSFTVTLSSPVSGLSASNFSLNPTIVGAGIASVSPATGASATYTVVVNTGTGNGTLQLNVANAAGLTPSVTNAPFSGASAAYTITKSFAAQPQLTIVGTGGTGGDVTAFVDVVQVLSGGTAFANALQNGSFETHNTLGSGNGTYGYNPTGAVWTFNAQSGIANGGSAFNPVLPIPNGVAVGVVQGLGQLQQPLALPTGSSYQVSFQTSQRNCCNSSFNQVLNVLLNGVFLGTIQPANNNTYFPFASAVFSVTAPALTATVSTTSTSPTSTSPIPFAVSFSQPVGTTFTATDLTVTGGTLNAASFSGSGAGPYTFTVTPTGAGTVSVSLAAGVATDANNTGNAASNAVSVQYVPVSLSSVSPAAELPGQTVTLTGTGFASSSTVSFGTTAAIVTLVSATTLTVTVPAGLAPGSAPVSVSTGSTTTPTQPFAVLAVYDGGTLGSCAAAVPATASVGDGAWHYLMSSAGQVVAAYNYTGASLGTLALDVLRADPNQPVRQDAGNRFYLGRNWHLTNSTGRFDGRAVGLRLYGLNGEQARLQVADPTATLTNLKATQYSGPNEDCDLANDVASAEHRVLAAPASSPAGTAYFVAELAVADHFSEFYLTGSPTPLPVELTAFTATAVGNRAVRVDWATASEKNADRFDVERSRDGRSFERISQVAAAGSSSTPRSYGLWDEQLPAGAVLLYYRLRQVDADGTFSFSPVRTATLTGAGAGLNLYPNPAPAGHGRGGAATLQGAQPGAAVTVHDALGRPVTSATADAAGMAALVLPAGLPTGVYVVRVGSQALRLTVE